MALRENTLLQGGKYRIIRFIASGGFGCTYEAEHVLLHKRVAIKEFFVRDFCNRDDTTGTVSVGTTSRGRFVEKLKGKFLDEASSLSRLNHPGIVKVMDVFEENGTAYFVMDYVDGESLSDMVKRRGRLPEHEALKYILNICSALEYVHAHNRLHLDIKPGNILVDGRGHAILIDFGASKQYDEYNGENNSTLLGKTPGYAPLEQLSNDVGTFMPATDIYSLAATLYKLLTGQTPPPSNLLAGGAPLPPLPANTSPGVYNAVMWAMSSNKLSRPQTIAAFRNALYGTGSGNTCPVPPAGEETVANDEEPPKKSHKGLIAAIAGGVCLILLIFLAAKGCSPSAGDDTVVATDTVVTVATSVTDMPYTNAKGEKFTYTGQVTQDSVPDGEGTGVYEHGTYKGTYVSGLRQGKAVYDTKNGENHFEGTYDDDMYKEGKMIFDDKSYYVGTFKDNDFYTGKFYNADGSVDETITKGKTDTK